MPVLSSNSTRNAPVQVMLPIRLMDVLNDLALKSGRSRSSLIRDALEKALFVDATLPDVTVDESTTTTMKEDN